LKEKSDPSFSKISLTGERQANFQNRYSDNQFGENPSSKKYHSHIQATNSFRFNLSKFDPSFNEQTNNWKIGFSKRLHS
jgi:hypothetical protein